VSHQYLTVPPGHSILRRREVEARTGLSRSTIYAKIAQGCFPRPIKLGERAVGFVASEIDAWLSKRVAARDQGVRT
jgi:prophage regulatory protein